jgi:FtsH-binding integral membrane protein
MLAKNPLLLSWSALLLMSCFIRYDINRIKMKANDILTSSETNTDEAIALGIDISKTANYKEGQLTRR